MPANTPLPPNFASDDDEPTPASTSRPPAESEPPERKYDVRKFTEYPRDKRVTLSAEEREEALTLADRLCDAIDVTGLEPVPFPTKSSRILALLDDPDYDVEQLVQYTRRDPALAASILRVANSAASGTLVKVENLRDAVMLLGGSTVAGIATALAARGVFEAGASRAKGVFREVWSMLGVLSVTSGFAAGRLSLEHRKGDLEQCLLGGMLHDVGKTFALRKLGEGWLAEQGVHQPSAALIHAILEEVHVELGQAAAEQWKFPPYLVDMCGRHHGQYPEESESLQVVRVASHVSAIFLNPCHRPGIADETQDTVKALGLDPFALRAFCTGVRADAAKARAV